MLATALSLKYCARAFLRIHCVYAGGNRKSEQPMPSDRPGNSALLCTVFFRSIGPKPERRSTEWGTNGVRLRSVSGGWRMCKDFGMFGDRAGGACDKKSWPGRTTYAFIAYF